MMLFEGYDWNTTTALHRTRGATLAHAEVVLRSLELGLRKWSRTKREGLIWPQTRVQLLHHDTDL